MKNELKTMYDQSVLDIKDLSTQLAARDQLITAIVAIMGPIRLPVSVLDEVNSGKWVGFDVEPNAAADSVTLTVRAGESDEPEQGSEEGK